MAKSPEDLNVNSISLLIDPARTGVAESRERLFTELRSYLEMVASRGMNNQLSQKVGTSDIVQASFVRILEKFDQFRGKSSAELKAWIKTIVTNEVNTAHRSFRAEKRNVARELGLAPATESQAGIDLTDPQLTPSSDALRKEQNRKFHEILGQMSEDDATVIRLRNIEKISFREIGATMNRSEQAASQLWYRAILRFEEKLRATGEFGAEPK